MTILTNFLRSLLLTMIFSFAAPLFFVGIVLGVAFTVNYIPGLHGIAQAAPNHILQFLAIFGSGTPLRGIFVICLTCSFVGGLFDSYVVYRHQILRIDS